MVAAASPPPAPAPHATPDRGHPTYTKMITHALTELGGCSERPGITDYIHDCFSGLPPSHDGLLNAHLRRLVAEGVLRTDGADSPSYTFAPPSPAGEKPPSAEKRGPGRPRKDTGASTPVATPLGEKRGRGRPRKSPQGSSEKPAHTGIATPWLFATTQEASEPIQAGGEARNFQNGGDATPVQSGGASSAGMKRGPGRPRKEKPSVAAAAAAISPEPSTTPSSTPGSKRGRGRPRKEKPSEAALYRTGRGAALRGFKRGCGRPTMDRAAAAAAFSAETSMEKLAAAAAAMYAETGDTASAGGGQSKMEKLAAAAVAAMSAEGTKRGRGRPRKVKPPSAAVAAMFAEGTKRGRGRPRKVKPPSVSAYEAFFRDMMAEDNTRRRRREEEEDSVSGEKTQTEEGVAPGKGKETRDADAGRVPVSGENAASASVDATDPDLGPVNFADDATSTGIKRPRGRPRKYPAAADAGMSTGVKRRRVRPREKPVEVTSAPETGDAVSTGVKRGRGRPRKYPGAASTDVKKVKRGRGRPWKRRNTIGTGFVEAGGEVLFRNVTEAPGDPVSGKKTQTEDAAPVYRKETRVAGAGHVPVSGENAVSAPVSSLGSDSKGPANL